MRCVDALGIWHAHRRRVHWLAQCGGVNCMIFVPPVAWVSDMRVHSDAHHACSFAWRLCDTAIWKAIPENYA
jgi:hypothetical protein